MAAKLSNWAGNYTYSTINLHQPSNIEQVQTIVKQNGKLRVLGTRHSFNGLADSDEILVTLERLEPNVTISRADNSVTFNANVTYGDLCKVVHAEGFALHNLASLGHISVVGACATATHGSGVTNQNLASMVTAMEIVNPDGELVHLSRQSDGDMFDGAVVSLGALGVIVKLTLKLLPVFDMRQTVFENLHIKQLNDYFDEIISSAYSVSLFTNWKSDYINQVWVKQRVGDRNIAIENPDFFGAVAARRQMHPIAELSGDNCTEQLGVDGPWYERLPHFRMDATPSAGEELQSEYFVSRQDAVPAIRAVSSIREAFAPYLLISEIRSIAADNLWMSPCYHQDSVAIHFTWKPDWVHVKKLLPIIEEQLAPFHARPHWGKLFTMPPERLRSLYECLPQFRALLNHYDPHGKFRNSFLDTFLFND